MQEKPNLKDRLTIPSFCCWCKKKKTVENFRLIKSGETISGTPEATRNSNVEMDAKQNEKTLMDIIAKPTVKDTLSLYLANENYRQLAQTNKTLLKKLNPSLNLTTYK